MFTIEANLTSIQNKLIKKKLNLELFSQFPSISTPFQFPEMQLEISETQLETSEIQSEIVS